MSTLIFDPFAGISGDMTLAALLDLGLSEEWLRDFERPRLRSYQVMARPAPYLVPHVRALPTLRIGPRR